MAVKYVMKHSLERLVLKDISTCIVVSTCILVMCEIRHSV